MLWLLIVCVRIRFVLVVGVITEGSAAIEKSEETATMIVQIVQELVFAARTFRIGCRATWFARCKAKQSSSTINQAS